MIKKSICILLLLGAVAAVVFAVLDRKNTHTLLPLPSNKVVTTTEPDAPHIAPDSVEVANISLE
jgi:hypothetical protein